MKKLFLIPLLLVSLNAADHDLYDHSFSIVGSYASNADQMPLKSGFGWGLRFNGNRSTEHPWEIGSYQWAFDYQNKEDYKNGGNSNLYRLGLNAIWYWDNYSPYTPYALLGGGFQVFGDKAQGAKNGIFGNVGVGVEYQLRGDLSLFGEEKYLYSGKNSTFLTSFGVKYSFGQ